MMKSLPALLGSALLVTLAGCGGGGGGVAMPAPGPATVAIASGNQTMVTRAIVSSGSALALAQPLAAPGRSASLAAPKRSATPVAVVPMVVTRAVRQLAPALRAAASERRQALAVSTESEACDLAGTITTTFDDRDNNGAASANDVVTIRFANCRVSASDLVNGTVVVRVASVTSNTATLLALGGSMAFQHVMAAFGDTSASIDGSLDVAIEARPDSLQLAIVVGAGGLRIDASAPAYTDSIVYATSMRIAIFENDAAPASTSISLDGTFSATSIGGAVTVATLQPIRQLYTEANPGSGQLLASGAGRSQLRITVIDTTQVRLELDANGDGAFEATTAVPWSVLAPV